MTLLMALTDPQKVKTIFGSRCYETIDGIETKFPEETIAYDESMKSFWSCNLLNLLAEIIVGKYENRDPNYNFYYGEAYWLICRYYGEQLDENEFFHDQDVNFIFDKFPKELYDKGNGNYFFPLPKFDFPIFISLNTEEILRLEAHIKSIGSYKTDYVQLDENELDNLKNMFLKALNLAKEKNMGIVFRLDD